MENFRIHVDLVPKTCWFSNVRSQVSVANWDRLRKAAYANSDHVCSICHKKNRLEAHEIWHYDDIKHIQKLHTIVAVCKYCHEIYHLGFASLHGNLPRASKWLSKINGWSFDQTQEYINIVFEIFYRRSNHEWKLDLSFLDNLKIPYKLISEKEPRNNLK